MQFVFSIIALVFQFFKVFQTIFSLFQPVGSE